MAGNAGGEYFIWKGHRGVARDEHFALTTLSTAGRLVTKRLALTGQYIICPETHTSTNQVIIRNAHFCYSYSGARKRCLE